MSQRGQDRVLFSCPLTWLETRAWALVSSSEWEKEHMAYENRRSPSSGRRRRDPRLYEECPLTVHRYIVSTQFRFNFFRDMTYCSSCTETTTSLTGADNSERAADTIEKVTTSDKADSMAV